jgi:hypothetical protein
MTRISVRMATLTAALGFLPGMLAAAEPAPAAPGINIVAVLWVIIGIVFMGFGWNLYKVTIALSGLVLGLMTAQFLGDHFTVGVTLRYTLVIVLAVAGFILAFPFQKAIVFIMGGLGGAILVSRPVEMIFVSGPHKTAFAIGGLVVGFLLFGALSIYFFRSIIIVSTSLIGAFYLLIGLHNILQERGAAARVLTWIDPAAQGFLTFLLLAAAGIILQHRYGREYPGPDQPSAGKGPVPPGAKPAR